MKEVNHWIEILGTAVDLALLLRIGQLKLYRTYFFITLVCILNVFFDGVALWLGSSSAEFARVFFYSRFLYAFVFPMAAYDVWEEVKSHVGRIRKLAMFRLISSLLVAAIFGLIIGVFASDDAAGASSAENTFAVILWAASSTASLGFLWSMHRLTRAQKVELVGNTPVWLLFFELSFVGEVVGCFLVIVGQLLKNVIAVALDTSLSLFGLLITVWCIWKLKAPVSDVPTAPEKASP